MSSVFLASHREKLVCNSFGSDGSFGDPVDEHRKRSCNLVGVRVVHEENAFMHCVVSDKAARIAKFLHIRGKLQAKNLRAKIVPFSFKVDTKPFKRKAQHRAGASGRATDDRLSLHVRNPNIVRHVFGWGNRREFGPHHFSLNPEGWFTAGNTSGDAGFLNVRQGECLKTVVDKSLLRELYVSGRIRNVIQLGKPFDQGAEDHLGFCAAVRARK